MNLNAVVQGYDNQLLLKPKQEEALSFLSKYSSHKRDLIVNLPVGYGKSIIYHLLPAVMKMSGWSDPVVLVISPLNIIQEDQLQSLQNHGITACRLGRPSDCENGEEKCLPMVSTSTQSSLQDGKFFIVLCHPEALLNTTAGKELLFDEKFRCRVAGIVIVIDECHITLHEKCFLDKPRKYVYQSINFTKFTTRQKGKEFRTSFGKLHVLPCTFPDVPVVALSGSLTVAQLKDLPVTLGMRSPYVVQESPDRENIYLQCRNKISGKDTEQLYESIFIDECNKLKQSPAMYPVTLLFIPLFYMSKALCYLKFLFGPHDISSSVYSALFSRQDKDVLDITTKELKKDNPRIRLMLCTSAAGMGFDPSGVAQIIHACPPRSVSTYLQEIGRSGRRGQRSSATLYFSNSDLRSNLPGIKQDISDYCNATGCLRESLLSVFGFTKNEGMRGCECCSNCKLVCDCDECFVNATNDILHINEQ